MLPTVEAVARELSGYGSSMEILISRYAGHAASLAGDLPESVDALLVVGGDGTVCEVVNGLNGRPTPVAILRTGTENLLARTLDMPTEVEAVANTLFQGKPIEFDVGLVNDRRFLAVAGVGFDAECVEFMARNRKGHIMHLDYFWPIWRTFWGHRFPYLAVEADDRVVFEGRGFAMVGNISRYGAGLNILKKARFDDGLLDLCVFACRSRLELLRHTVCVLSGKQLSSPNIHYVQCKQASIQSSDNVPLQLDGDSNGSLPAQFSIKPAAARFLIHAHNSAIINTNSSLIMPIGAL